MFSGATLTGFDYSERTFLTIQDLFFKVEISSGLYVRLRAGRIHTSTGYVFVPDQLVGPFSVPGSPNSRIDLIYIAADGTVTVLQGTQAVSPSAPSYDNKLVVAEITLVNGDVSIPASRIRDVRSFITTKDIWSSRETKVNNTVYLADTNGEVAAITQNSNTVQGFSDSNNPPSNRVAANTSASGNAAGINFSVKKGDYWKVTGADGVQWMPKGS